VGTVAAGTVLIAAGFTFGYPELTVLGAAALVAAACAVGYAAWRPILSVSRQVQPDRVSRGEDCAQTLTVHNSSRLRAATLIAQDTCGTSMLPVPLIRLRPNQDTCVRYPVPTLRRGLIRLGPLRVTRRDPLGLIGVARTHGGTAQVWVHPRVHPLAAVPVGIARSLDGRVDRVPHGSITFDTLREYVIGDELRRVHWRTSARIGELMVREHLDTSLPRIVLLVDDRDAAHPDRRDGISDGFEHVCEAAASVLAAAVREDLSAQLLMVSGGAPMGTGEHRAAGPADTRPLLDRLAEAELVDTPLPAARGRTAPAGTVPGGAIPDGAVPGRPHAGTDPLTIITRRLRQHRYGDTLVYLTGTGRPDDLAMIGALHSRYPTIVAGVFGDPTAVPSTVEGMHLLAVASALDFATGWDGLGTW
jgi:uncharacterized protein (DUF58 family)